MNISNKKVIFETEGVIKAFPIQDGCIYVFPDDNTLCSGYLVLYSKMSLGDIECLKKMIYFNWYSACIN